MCKTDRHCIGVLIEKMAVSQSNINQRSIRDNLFSIYCSVLYINMTTLIEYNNLNSRKLFH